MTSSSPMAEAANSTEERSLNEQNLLKSAILGSASPLEALFQRRIEFTTARRDGSAVGVVDENFRMEKLNPSSDSHRPVPSPGECRKEKAEVGTVKRSDTGDSNEHGMDPEISFSITFRRIGAGLANLGNTCFLNSVLQCLTYTEPFAAYLQSGKHKSSCHTSGFCAMCALQNHVMTALQSSGKILSPSHLVKNLRCISRNFRNSRQEDAHEYMVNLLESMHKCCLPSGVPSESPSAYERSLVHKIFGGQLRSQVKCTQCCFSSNKFDPFLDLSLEIVKADSLCKALSHFTAVEQLDGGERQYQCQRCKQKVRALKQLTMHKTPYVLTIHLKRFGSDVPGQKIDRRVDFEPSLDLKPFVSDTHEGNLKYTLYGVLVHAGWSTHSGHYYCYVRTSSGLWHSLNDNQVSQVSEKVVLAQKAYMLFYIRNRNSGPKKPIDAAANGNSFANMSGNRGADISLQGLDKATHGGPLNRRLHPFDQGSIMSKVDVLVQDKIVSAKITSPTNSLMRKVSTQKSNCDLPVEAQSNGGVGKELQQAAIVDHKLEHSIKISSLLDSLSNTDALKRTGENFPSDCLTESDSSSKENSCRMMVKNLVMSLSTSNKDMSVSKVSAKSAFSNGNVVGQDANTIVQENHHGHSTGASKSLPSNEGSGTSSKVADDIKSDKNGTLKIINHSSNVGGSLLNRMLGPAIPAPQGCYSSERCQRDLMGEGSGDDALKKKFGQANSPNQFTTLNVCLQKKDVSASCKDNSDSTDNETCARIKKGVMKMHKKSMQFGPRCLLFASLSLRKKKKNKRRKKYLGEKNISNLETIEASVSGCLEASTSGMINVIEKQKMWSAKKQSYLNLKLNEPDPTKDDDNRNRSMVRFAGVRDVEDNVMLASSSLPESVLKQAIGDFGVKEMDNNDKKTQSSIMSILMRGLGEARVPKWDDEEPSSSTRALMDAPPRSIGYVLDEWDEEYDRGKRKKVKKARQFSFGTNPFEEIALHNKQQKMKRMKLDHTSSGNQPFRI